MSAWPFEAPFVLFVTGDQNNEYDAYWRDVTTGITKLASSDAAGNGTPVALTLNVTLSADGRYVGFLTSASLIPGDSNGGAYDVYVKDVVTNGIVRASTQTGGAQLPNPACWNLSLSGNGRYVAMRCGAPDLVLGDTNNKYDIFIKDLQTNVTTMVSRVANGAIGNQNSDTPIVSKDGSLVGFTSDASNLTVPDNNGMPDVFVGTRN